MYAEENKAVVCREMEEVFNHTGDLDVAEVICASAYVGHEPTTGDIRGMKSIKRFAAYRQGLPDLETTIENQVAGADKMVTCCTARCTPTRGWRG